MTGFANRFKQSMVFLARGQEQGHPTWYYILVKDRAKLEQLHKSCQDKSNTIPLAEYGDIIESGWGENPPFDIQQKIQASYS